MVSPASTANGNRSLRGNGIQDFCRGSFRAWNSRHWRSCFVTSQSERCIRQSSSEMPVDAVQRLNGLANERFDDPEIATRISQYELAFRMQSSVPELMDVSKEPLHIFDLYGTKGAATVLLHRTVYWLADLPNGGNSFHPALSSRLGSSRRGEGTFCRTAKEVDQGVAALITDLKQRDMLKDTIIVFCARVRADSDGSGQRRSRSSPRRFHHVVRRRWLQARHELRRNGRVWLSCCGRTACQSTTSTPPCSTSWVSITCDNYLQVQGLDARLTGVEESRIVNELLV